MSASVHCAPGRLRRTSVSRAAGLALLGLGAAWAAQAQTPPPVFTRTIDSLVEVRRQAPFFGAYTLPTDQSLRITPDGELNAPTQSTGAAIGLLGRVLNEGKLRAGYGSETMGLQVSGELTNAGGSLAAPSGLIEAVQLVAYANARISNFGALFTGSHTFPAGSGPAAGQRAAFQSQGAALPETGFFIEQGGRIENKVGGFWSSEGNGQVLGTLSNEGLWIGQAAPAMLPQGFGSPAYLRVLRVGQEWLDSPVGRIENHGQMLLDTQTVLMNAGTVVNAVQWAMAGQMDMLRHGTFRNEMGAEFTVGGRLTVSAFSPYEGGVQNHGTLVLQRGGQLLNQGRVVNGLTGGLFVAAAVPVPGGGVLYEAGSVLQTDTAMLENHNLIEVKGSFSGGSIENLGGRIEVGPGGRLAVLGIFGGDVRNAGGHVEIGPNALVAVDGFTQTDGRLTVNGQLDMAPGAELRILGGVLDGGGTLNPLTGTVDGGGFINGNLFLSGAGGGPVQQPPYCFATGWACFRPGNSPGAVQINGDLVLADNAVLQLEIERDASGVLQWDTVLATTMHFGAGSVIEVVLGQGVDTAGLPVELLRCDAGCSFAGSFHVLGGSGQFVADAGGLHFSGVSAVPEPGTWALLAGGLAVCALRARLVRQTDLSRQA